MILELVDSDKKPFVYSALEHGLTSAQVKKIYDLMDRVRISIKKNKPMNRQDFEDEIYKIIPSRKGDYHFAEEIVSTLNEERRWQDVYLHMKKDGMNI